MSRSMFVAGLLACGCLLASSIAASAKGLPTEVTVNGPGLSAPLHVTDPFATASLGITSFMRADKPLARPPTGLGLSYEIERDGFDHVRYYPGGSLGDSYVYYEGLINGSSEYDRHWYPVTAEGDIAIRMLLAASGVQETDVVRGINPLADGTLARARTVLANASVAPRDGQQQSGGVPVAA